jgi:hypothetical protein
MREGAQSGSPARNVALLCQKEAADANGNRGLARLKAPALSGARQITTSHGDLTGGAHASSIVSLPMVKAKRVGALAVVVGTLAFAPAADGGDMRLTPRAVIELFTSQGCSSCPPADALFAELAGRDDIVALAYHVDYWDYIGWPDTFGAKENSDLQRAYAESWGSSRIFTPQLIVNGAESVVGSRRSEVTGALDTATLAVPVKLGTTGDDMLEIEIVGQPGAPDGMVWLVTFLDRSHVRIERGENEGETIAYTQIVTGRHLLGMWEAASGTHLKLPLAEVLDGPANGLAVLVQEDRNGLPGPILGAALYQP